MHLFTTEYVKQHVLSYIQYSHNRVVTVVNFSEGAEADVDSYLQLRFYKLWPLFCNS